MQKSDHRAEVVMYRADTIGAILRLWCFDEKDRLRASAELLLEEEYLEELLGLVRVARIAASQPTLF